MWRPLSRLSRDKERDRDRGRDKKSERDTETQRRSIVYKKGFDVYNGYYSDILNKPTFKDLFNIADDMVECTEDYGHTFFEGKEIKGLIAGGIMEIDYGWGG